MGKLIPMADHVERSKPKRNFDAKLDTDNDNEEGYEDLPIPPKKITPFKSKKIISPSELNLSLRSKYGIPLSVSRYQIDGYLTSIQDQNHKYFLKRYAINGKEFDVCWLLCIGETDMEKSFIPRIFLL